MKYSNSRGKKLRGFTIVELLVAITIMMGMTGVFLFKYPETTVKVTLANANNSLLSFVREAQLRGSSIDSLNGKLGGYGVFISDTKPTEAILFGDAVDVTVPHTEGILLGNGLYNKIPLDEKKSVITLQPRYSFKKLCIGTTTPYSPTGFVCGDNYSTHINSLTISFKRPNQIAHIYINGATSTDFISACIQSYSYKTPSVGHVRSLRIYHSGMMQSTTKPCD